MADDKVFRRHIEEIKQDLISAMKAGLPYARFFDFKEQHIPVDKLAICIGEIDKILSKDNVEILDEFHLFEKYGEIHDMHCKNCGVVIIPSPLGWIHGKEDWCKGIRRNLCVPSNKDSKVAETRV